MQITNLSPINTLEHIMRSFTPSHQQSCPSSCLKQETQRLHYNRARRIYTLTCPYHHSSTWSCPSSFLYTATSIPQMISWPQFVVCWCWRSHWSGWSPLFWAWISLRNLSDPGGGCMSALRSLVTSEDCTSCRGISWPSHCAAIVACNHSYDFWSVHVESIMPYSWLLKCWSSSAGNKFCPYPVNMGMGHCCIGMIFYHNHP